MSILPSAKVTLDPTLSQKKCEKIGRQISAIKGVLSAAFNAQTKTIDVTYSLRERHSLSEIRNIEGVVDMSL